MDSCDDYSSRSDTPISTIDVENDDVDLQSHQHHYHTNRYSDDDVSSSDEHSCHSHDSNLGSSRRLEQKSDSDRDEVRPKLSFGISAILGDVIQPRSKSPSSRSDEGPSQHDITSNYRRLFATNFDNSDGQPQPFAGYSMIGADGRPLIPTASPPLGLVHHSASLNDTEYIRGPGGLIKVPAHRPPLGHLDFNPLMFPWMQERKERLAGT